MADILSRMGRIAIRPQRRRFDGPCAFATGVWGDMAMSLSRCDFKDRRIFSDPKGRTLCREFGQIDSIWSGTSKHQRPDGSWLPLWFGNQHAPDDINPTYGTAKVLAAYRDLKFADAEPAQRGVKWLLDNQNDDGGWGGGRGTPSSLEETALAVEVLLDLAPANAKSMVERGLLWLVERVEAGGLHEPTPIGFYFAKLWYFEKLYPIVWTVAALGRAIRG